ncbi:MAG: type IV pilus assembly protein PilM [Candidatus Desantisbacteria bacterium]|mgnify:CR=1 FL=1
MLFGSGKGSIGLDISSDAVKVVRLKKVGNNVVLTGIGLEKIAPEPLDEDAVGAKHELTVKAIKTMLYNNGIDTKKVRTSVSGNSVVVRYVKLPHMSATELRDVIRFEAEEHIPFDIEHVIIDFQIIKEMIEKDERMILVLLVAAKEELIYDHMEILQRSGLETLHINVDTFAVEDALVSDGKEEEVVALVDIGARMTNINVVENKCSCFNRDILVGGNDFTETIKRELGVNFLEAEQIKEAEGVIIHSEDLSSGTYSERMSHISYAIESVGARLLDELERSFAYYYTQLPVYRKNIDKVFLSGGTARLKNLDEFLAAGLGIPVVIADPFVNIKMSPKVNVNTIKKYGSAFTVAIGLALRGLK